ncbi:MULTISPECIES: YigZ family protein [Carboxydocella]|uniref:Uncharacterized protein, YigZ family n=2 Tax=Carboxydocella TaxID=178898 RepID=A0A1T4Q1S3_9FIRM|nr:MULTISPECIES: YigZ family protein [Carboxydocella]AVX21214.1 uncharacterized protein, YigZ family [Carboxydocella thermautotrophica]AVX31646.1 uncharacterized protein, YigZ family [Carboxydocella thermautotrophica]GAW30938.1 uncharacterized protein, YigZ family [Carboxydocella sp. JDF658]SJZ97723.1 uncharacterized protein, YigZ family [Carboxydocella sporoproducens DSM 16521]
MDSYRSVGREAVAEIVIKKSRFICYVKPVETAEAAQEFVEAIRKKHWDATHNVPAWRVGMPVPAERFSDDGEPAGTAGMPVLEVLRKQEVTNCVLVVTRYFGGTLLGAGGLVRAYTESAVKGLEAAGIVTYHLYRRFTIIVPYPLLGSILHLLEKLEGKLEEPLYGAEVQVRGWLLPELQNKLEKEVAELGQGQLQVEWGESCYLP